MVARHPTTGERREQTEFWGDDSQDWYYDLLYLTCNLVILATGGGSLVLA